MARDLPDALRLRDLKYDPKTPSAERSRAAEGFLSAGRTAEALDLFLLAGDEAGLEKLARIAVEKGRPMLLLMLQRGGREVSAGDWSAAGEVAFREERWREAYRCFLQARDEDALARVQEKLPGYEIYIPDQK